MRIFSSVFEHDRKNEETVKIYLYNKLNSKYEIRIELCDIFDEVIRTKGFYVNSLKEGRKLFMSLVQQEIENEKVI